VTERRYNEDEVAAIFERATAVESQRQPIPLASSKGMTLADLQAIGGQVGISAELMAEAARSLDVIGQPTERRWLGLPIGVGRTVELPRKLREDEWERLVVDLRETFDAKGRLRTEGSFRQWTNGNLQALLEPTESGQRLRLRTVKGNAQGYMLGGIALAVAGGFASLMRVMAGEADPWRVVAVLAVGGGMFLLGAVQLAPWARTRRQQMEAIARRLTDSVVAR
jgi:hypothetical protein